MIGKMYGIVNEKKADHIILLVHDIGYIVYVGRALLSSLDKNSKVCLYIETHVYEGNIKLYGFENENEIEYFKRLIKIKGVSYKIGISLLGNIGIDGINNAILRNDENLLKVSGIGPKIARRIMVELTDTNFINEEIMRSTITENNIINDSIAALIHLGYEHSKAFKAVHDIEKTEGFDSSTIIKLALQKLQNGR